MIDHLGQASHSVVQSQTSRVSSRQADALRRLQSGDARFASAMHTHMETQRQQALKAQDAVRLAERAQKPAEPAAEKAVEPKAVKRVSAQVRAVQQTNPVPVALEPAALEATTLAPSSQSASSSGRPAILGGADLNRLVFDVQQVAQENGFVGLSQDAVIRAYHHGQSLLVDTHA